MSTQENDTNVAAIEFRNVSLSFDDTPALVDVSFRLESGEMIFLTGNSGSGKSVLLRLAIGLLKPDEGQIFVKGYEIDTLSESELLAVRGGSLGFVFQEDTLFSGLSVYDNVSYRLKEHGWDDERIDVAVGEVLQFVGLSSEEEKLPEELSGGMKRRVEIARSIIGWPSIMLFDEATSGLDPIVAGQILDLIIRTRDLNRISSIYVTKKLYEIPYLANYSAQENQGNVKVVPVPPAQRAITRVIVLDRGRIEFCGSVAEFETSTSPVVQSLKVLERPGNSQERNHSDPWKSRRKDIDLFASHS